MGPKMAKIEAKMAIMRVKKSSENLVKNLELFRGHLTPCLEPKTAQLEAN